MPELSYQMRTIIFYASRILLVLLALGLVIGAIVLVSNWASSDDSGSTTETTQTTETTKEDASNGPIQQEYDAITEGEAEEAQQQADADAKAEAQAQKEAQQQAAAEKKQREAAQKQAAANKQAASKSDIPNTGPMDVISVFAVPVIVYALVRYYDTKKALVTPPKS